MERLNLKNLNSINYTAFLLYKTMNKNILLLISILVFQCNSPQKHEHDEQEKIAYQENEKTLDCSSFSDFYKTHWVEEDERLERKDSVTSLSLEGVKVKWELGDYEI